jgi:transglutaminase-like putative cysteine protease
VPRTALLYIAPAALVATGWLFLEEGQAQRGSALFLVVLALLPGLARTWRLRAAATLLVAPLAVAHAFGRGVSRDFVGPLAGDLADGVLTFYDVTVPFTAGDQPMMHGAVLTAIFVFCLAISLAIGSRRPLLASLALVAGAAWPATLVGDSNELRRGALLLAAVLAMLAFGGRVQPRTWRPALVAGGALVAVALAAGTQPAVAKGEFLSWKGWDLYDRPSDPVGVDYVWDASYRGIKFPKEPTTVLTVTGPRRTYYWRAGTLDVFEGDRWIEDSPTINTMSGRSDLPLADPLLAQRARDQSGWVEARVRIDALRDDHLVAPGTPVTWDTGEIGTVEHKVGGTAVVPGGLERDDAYTVWGYSPRPTPQELARAEPGRALRGTAESRYLEVARGVPTLPFAAEDREERIESLFESPELASYEFLYREAREVVGNPRRPYAAVAALEAWFRRGGGFTYDEQPPQTPNFPALVTFATTHKRGYCQHFAGAMTLMLRYLGIPARVAVGFLPGSYDSSEQRWAVTDHDAHAWVEVWFEGWGWLPFDPTPGRGSLAAPYSSASGTPSALSQIAGILRQEGAGIGGQSQFGLAQGTQPSRDIPGEATGALADGGDRTGSLLRLLLVVAAALVALIGAAKLARRLLRLLPSDPRRVAAACRRELADYLVDQGAPVSRSATALELGRVVESRLFVDADAFVRAVGAARFGPPEQARAAARSARRELRALRRQLRRTVSARRRAQGFLSVRSLGLGASG